MEEPNSTRFLIEHLPKDKFRGVPLGCLRQRKDNPHPFRYPVGMDQPKNRKPADLKPQAKIENCSVVADILRDWPETIPVFLKRRLSCVGCELSVFDTVAEVARTYKFDAGAFLEELQGAIQSAGPGCDLAD
jgi:hybrid cluster-associated redox disulfide protein